MTVLKVASSFDNVINVITGVVVTWNLWDGPHLLQLFCMCEFDIVLCLPRRLLVLHLFCIMEAMLYIPFVYLFLFFTLEEPGKISLCKTRSISPTSPSTSSSGLHSITHQRITLQKSGRRAASMDSMLDQANNNAPLTKPVPKPRHRLSSRQHSLQSSQPERHSLGSSVDHSMSFIQPHFGDLADKEEITATQATDDSLCTPSTASLDYKPTYKSWLNHKHFGVVGPCFLCCDVSYLVFWCCHTCLPPT